MGQWVHDHKLTVEQAVTQSQKGFTPLGLYRTIIIGGRYMSKGGVSGVYRYGMATTQLSKTLERN
jgi:hypothetical protein